MINYCPTIINSPPVFIIEINLEDEALEKCYTDDNFLTGIKVGRHLNCSVKFIRPVKMCPSGNWKFCA